MAPKEIVGILYIFMPFFSLTFFFSFSMCTSFSFYLLVLFPLFLPLLDFKGDTVVT